MAGIPIEIEPGKIIEISPGDQSCLIEMICREFASRFMSGARLIYVHDPEDATIYFNKEQFEKLGMTADFQCKMPSVILHHAQLNWLVVVEAVVMQVPINSMRRAELRTILAGSKAELVLVTAFLDKPTFLKYAGEIAWNTGVWIADSPSHMIHFDGERLYGPGTQHILQSR